MTTSVVLGATAPQNKINMQIAPATVTGPGARHQEMTLMQHESIPAGLCQCGCGEATSLAPIDRPRLGHVKGEPLRYISTHTARMRIEYVERDLGYKTPCWIFKGRDDRLHTYGAVERKGTKGGHRLMYERHRGPIPAGRFLDHLCRIPACVNPWHLDPVTSAENLRRGKNAKLDWSRVISIRIMKATTSVSQTAMAEMFGVSVATISEIVNYRIWQLEKSFG